METSYTFVGSSHKGSQFQITYNFQTGYSYAIKINAAVINSGGTGANAAIVLNLNSSGNGSSTGCAGAATMPSTSSGNLYRSSTINSSSFSDYTLNWSALSGGQTFLTVGAVHPTGADNSQTILVRKITITPTAPSISFTLSPSSASVQCGSTLSQTFTVNNVYSTPGVTSYIWNLGANNGWTYNGSAAPSSITTGTNTLSLVSTGCANFKNISATAVIGSNNYNTNTSTITNTLPSMTVTGADVICNTAEVYTLNNLPCGASVSWSASPSNLVSLTPNGNQVSISKVGNGAISVTATITNACGLGTTISKNDIAVAVLPSASAMYFNLVEYSNNATNLCVNNGQYYDIYLPPITGATSYNLTISPSWAATVAYGSGTNTPTIVITASQGTFIDISMVAVNDCGNGYTTQVQGEVCGEIIPPRFAASPNPTIGDVQIESIDKKLTIKEIQVTDKYGNLKKQIKISSATTKHKISIAELPADVYIIRIFDGKRWTTRKVIKK